MVSIEALYGKGIIARMLGQKWLQQAIRSPISLRKYKIIQKCWSYLESCENNEEDTWSFEWGI